MKTAELDTRRFDQRIRLERKVETRDSTGDLVPAWGLLLDNVYAAVDSVFLGARAEAFLGARITAIADVTFTVRADVIERTLLTARDRIIWQGDVYDIRDAPLRQPRERTATIIAQQGVNDG